MEWVWTFENKFKMASHADYFYSAPTGLFLSVHEKTTENNKRKFSPLHNHYLSHYLRDHFSTTSTSDCPDEYIHCY